jgi:hypothetical protein
MASYAELQFSQSISNHNLGKAEDSNYRVPIVSHVCARKGLAGGSAGIVERSDG